MRKFARKWSFELGNNFIEEFVRKREDKSQWTPAQLKLLVETIVLFTDYYAQIHIPQGYLGDPLQLFRQLKALNEFVQEYGYHEEDEKIKNLESPVKEYIKFIAEYKKHPIWVTEVNATIHPVLDLCRNNFYFLQLQILQEVPEFSDQQMREGHIIINELLQRAIDAIEESRSYAQAKKNNQPLFYAEKSPKKKGDEKHEKAKRPSPRKHAATSDPVSPSKKLKPTPVSQSQLVCRSLFSSPTKIRDQDENVEKSSSSCVHYNKS